MTTTDTTAGDWLTMSDAAVRLGISERTVARRIRAGRLQTQVSDNGRRLVFITTGQGDEDRPSDNVGQNDGHQIQLFGTAIACAQRTADALEGQIMLAQGEIRTAKRSSRLAWSAVAVLAAASTVGVWWSTQTVTEQRSQLDTLTDQRDGLVRQVDDTQTRLEDDQARLSDTVGQLATITAERDAQLQLVEILTADRDRLQADLNRSWERLTAADDEQAGQGILGTLEAWMDAIKPLPPAESNEPNVYTSKER